LNCRTGREPTDAEASLFSYRIEFSIQCPACDGHVPLDGPLERTVCPSCRTEMDIPRDYWIDTLESSCRKMQEMEMGGGRGSILMGTFWGKLDLARFDPYCDECKTEFREPWHLEAGLAYRCEKCGAEYPVSAPPGWLKRGSPRIKLLINALCEVPDPTVNKTLLVTVSCPSCAAVLKADGGSRVVECYHCGVDVYLPDRVWHRFHPGRRKRRWFLICEHASEDTKT